MTTTATVNNTTAMNKKYKFLGETSFKCFVEHYNELKDFLMHYIAVETEEENLEDINILDICFERESLVVYYNFSYDEDERMLEVDYSEIDNCNN